MSKKRTRQQREERKRRRVSRRIAAKSVPSDLQIIEAAGFDSGFEITAAGDSDGDDGPKRFAMTAYTGGRLLLGNFPLPVVVDLTGIKAGGRSRPILRDHNMSQIVGHTTQIKVEASQIRLEGVVSGANAHAQEVIEAAHNGFPWQASIGARADRMVYVDEGEKVQVNGRSFTGPLYVARRSTLGEVSFVAIGADEGGATATVEATALKGNDTMNPFQEWLQAMGFAEDDLDDTQLKSLKAKFEAEQSNKPEDTIRASGAEDTIQASGASDPVAADNEAAAANVERIAAIGTLAESFPEIRVKAIRDGWTVEKTELEVLRASRPVHSEVAASGDGGARGYESDAIEAALLLQRGVAEERVEKFYSSQIVAKAVERKYNAMGLHALMDVCIAASGGHYSGSRKSHDFIRAAFIADRDLKAAGGFSTLSVTNVLESVANKSLIAAYEGIETTWAQLCAVRSASDFKALNRYRLDVTGAFKKVASDGELKHIELTDAKYTNQVDTYGAMISLTRQDIINDDLDAFMQIPQMLGRLSATRIEEAVYVLILGNSGSFFASGNNNLREGAASALDIDSLTDAKQSFRDFVDSNGKPILSSPRTLVVPTVLEQTGRNLLNEAMIIATDMSASADSTAPARNPHAGTLPGGLVVSPYLNNTNITDQDGAALSGQSDTQWYLFGDPNVRAAVTIAFLNGRRVPTIESAETDFNTLGMQWRGYHDFGVAFEEPIGAVKSTGTA